MLLPNKHSTSKTSSVNVVMVAQYYKIAMIPGDGIGVELTQATIQVLERLASIASIKFEFEHFDWSSEKYKERGWYMPPDGVSQLKKHDAIFFGAVGWPGKQPQKAHCCPVD